MKLHRLFEGLDRLAHGLRTLAELVLGAALMFWAVRDWRSSHFARWLLSLDWLVILRRMITGH